ncbi:hypothetical protein GCM10022219_21610 [Microbacterium oryzae]|uniref:CvpA family protein n=1 Tax=Microbacterium oryzae TaxID=743009 RepID=A0A6I6DXP5_9MICO|nr:CvpA family protein [Microbacterium oryzae]QGU27603.1 CvpA family protein [Microbacterium oryzae]
MSDPRSSTGGPLNGDPDDSAAADAQGGRVTDARDDADRDGQNGYAAGDENATDGQSPASTDGHDGLGTDEHDGSPATGGDGFAAGDRDPFATADREVFHDDDRDPFTHGEPEIFTSGSRSLFADADERDAAGFDSATTADDDTATRAMPEVAEERPAAVAFEPFGRSDDVDGESADASDSQHDERPAAVAFAPGADAAERATAGADDEPVADMPSFAPADADAEDRRDADDVNAAHDANNADASATDAANADAGDADDANADPHARPAAVAFDPDAPSLTRASEEADASAGRVPPIDNDRDGEPDFAALAAELEEFERRSADPSDSLAAPAHTRDDDDRTSPWFEPAKTDTFTSSEPQPQPQPEPEQDRPAAVTASEPAPHTTAAPETTAAPQPIFVRAPERPKMRGNRGAAGLIGLVAAVLFAVLFFAATLGSRLIAGDADFANIADQALQIATSFAFWVPVVVFWLGFWLLGVFVNRARWGKWVVFGLLVGVISYGGYILGQLFEAPFWMLTASEGGGLVADSLLHPLAIVAFILGREITIWFGAWAARRGARVSERNAEAQAEYERTLEAGPQLAQ